MDGARLNPAQQQINTSGGLVVSGDVQVSGGDFVGRDKIITIVNYNYATPKDNNVTRPSPYRGLYHFGPNDADIFFGRDKFIEELVESTRKQSFIPVLGASGSGKSSVVLAGLIPKLQRSAHWVFTHFRPGRDPFLALASALVPLFAEDLNLIDQKKQTRQLKLELEKGSLPLTDIVGIIQSKHSGHRLLLVIDQFEELFTLCSDEDARKNFIKILTEPCRMMVAPYSSIIIVTTMRADFLGQALDISELAEMLKQDVKLRPMTQAELREVIEKPAHQLNVTFEDGLVDRILNDVKSKPGNLPLLEFALDLLWKANTADTLKHSAYDAIGHVEGALASYANEKYQEFNQYEKKRVPFILTQMIHPGLRTEDTCRVATRSEIGEENWPLVRRLADARLVVTSQDSTGQDTVEVVHEALIRHWGKLDEWINEVRDFRVWQDQLRFDLQRWQVNLDAERLLRGTLLTEARHWLQEKAHNLSQVERQYIQLSVAQYEQELQKELIFQIFAQHVEGRDLREAQLSEAELKNANLSGSYLSGANLSKARLNRANLSTAELIGADLRNCDLSNADLSGANLKGAKLCNAILNGVLLSGVDLSEADLTGVNLYGVNLHNTKINDMTKMESKWLLVWELANEEKTERNLSGSDLSGAYLIDVCLSMADLSGANLSDAVLRNTRLNGADLSSANLSGTNLSGAQLDRANLRGAIINPMTEIDDKWRVVWEIITQSASERNLSKLDLSTAFLSGAFLYRAELIGTNLSGTDLSNAVLTDANLNDANLSGVNLVGTDLSGINLSSVNLSGANLRGVKLIGTNLAGANLSNAILTDADLTKANLSKTNLKDAEFNNTRLSNANISEANLVGADLSGVNFSSVDLSGADLQRANLAHATLARTILFRATLRGANLHEANLKGADLVETNLRGADLSDANLDEVKLRDAIYNSGTMWPKEFRYQATGAVNLGI